MVFPNGPDSRQVPFAVQCQGTNESFTNNTVISGTGQFYGSCAKCMSLNRPTLNSQCSTFNVQRSTNVEVVGAQGGLYPVQLTVASYCAPSSYVQ